MNCPDPKLFYHYKIGHPKFSFQNFHFCIFRQLFEVEYRTIDPYTGEVDSSAEPNVFFFGANNSTSMLVYEVFNLNWIDWIHKFHFA